jgi:hypothetical protein
MSTSFTLEQLQKLEAAIASGTTKVKYADKEVTYRSLSEMREILAMMRKELGISSQTSGRIYLDHDKGL